MVAAGALYLVGMFVVTMVFNVPLNNTLAVVNPASAGPSALGALPERLDLVEPCASDCPRPR